MTVAYRAAVFGGLGASNAVGWWWWWQHVQSLKTEIAILKDCRHPNIVCLQEVYETRTELFLVLEMYAARCLSWHIVNKPPAEDQDRRGRSVVGLVVIAHLRIWGWLGGVAIRRRARGGELFEQIVDHGPYSERDACTPRPLLGRAGRYWAQRCNRTDGYRLWCVCACVRVCGLPDV